MKVKFKLENFDTNFSVRVYEQLCSLFWHVETGRNEELEVGPDNQAVLDKKDLIERARAVKTKDPLAITAGDLKPEEPVKPRSLVRNYSKKSKVA